MKLMIAINYVNYDSEHKKNSQNIALSVLNKNKLKSTVLASINFSDEIVNVPASFNVLPMLKNDSKKDLGNNRRMPYVKEIFNVLSNMPSDIFGYMNSDILIKKNFFSVFKKDIDAYVFYKKDIECLTSEDFLNNNIKVTDEFPDGVDAFFFKRNWWIANKHFFPDGLILGETEWDTCYNSIIQSITTKYILERSLYHIKHDRIWSLDSRGAINNKLIWDNVRSKYGLPKFNPETRKT